MGASGEFELTIVRHGETDANKEGRLQGQINTHLNQTGKDQAAKAGRRLKDEHYDKVFCSDLDRAYETCSIILEHNEAKSSKEVDKTAVLRERSFGPWENKLITEYHAAAKAAGVEGFNWHAEGAETEAQEESRISKFFQMVVDDVKAHGDHKSLLVVTHGGLIYKMNCYLHGLSIISDLPKPDPRNASPPNTGVSKFSLKIDQEGKIVSGKCLIFMSGSHLYET